MSAVWCLMHEHEWEVEYIMDPNAAGRVVPSGDLVCTECGITKLDTNLYKEPELRYMLVNQKKIGPCVGILGRLLGHKFVARDSDVLYVYDNCARCNKKRIA